jgi:ATP-dependent DNA helicase PIF1
MDDNLNFAWDQLHDSAYHTLLTGNAGTGKSTLARKFINANEGEVVVLAPTGIAAVNIGGQTIHSFFHFPARPIGFNQIKLLNPAIPSDLLKRLIIERAKYFLIDEISMVRADLMDQIAWFFQKNFPDKGPFAGKKIIMIGDMDQLPPVVKEGPERDMIDARYKSEFFFDANCWGPGKEYSSTFKTVKLTKVWRQSDPDFINLLNAIKTNTVSPFDIDRLNNACYKDGIFKPEDGIFLCTTNALANEVNSEMLNRLDSKAIKLIGEIKGNFNEKDCTVDPVIDLKIGCRVMLMRNCKAIKEGEGYSNGEIGVLIDFKKIQTDFGDNDYLGQEEKISFLVVRLDNGRTIEVSSHEFESIEYNYNKGEDKISHKKTGTFIQYPVKVAYAITIHKSQGQSFDRVIIDLGENGAFAHGQTYVALSRCRSMQGLILRRAITHKDLIYNNHILEFNKLINKAPIEVPKYSGPGGCFDEPGCFNPEVINK